MSEIRSSLLHRAAVRANETGENHYVVEMDDEETRSQTVVSDRYVRSDDFLAFDGRILAIVAPDGSVEY